jgi:beta-phosphoglucomutase-like phosphatase (HAD superfamily)
MAMGIDDAIAAAAAGISLTDTCVRTIKAYRKQGKDLDIERLIEEVRITALQRMDEADLALAQFERTLAERGIGLDKTLQETIELTPFWQPFEAHRLKQIRKSFNALADATYSATDDIAALVRCKEQTRPMGAAVAESAKAKHDLLAKLQGAKSIRQSITLLRQELTRHKMSLA